MLKEMICNRSVHFKNMISDDDVTLMTQLEKAYAIMLAISFGSMLIGCTIGWLIFFRHYGTLVSVLIYGGCILAYSASVWLIMYDEMAKGNEYITSHTDSKLHYVLRLNSIDMCHIINIFQKSPSDITFMRSCLKIRLSQGDGSYVVAYAYFDMNSICLYGVFYKRYSDGIKKANKEEEKATKNKNTQDVINMINAAFPSDKRTDLDN